MSNETKDYLYDKACEVILEYGTMDKIDRVERPSYLGTYVYGWKNEQPVSLVVYFDDNLGAWQIEHRETT